MSYLRAEVDLAIQSQAILEISTWSCWSSQLSHSLSWLTKIIDFFVVWFPVTPKLGHGVGGCQVTGRERCFDCQCYDGDGGDADCGGGQCSCGTVVLWCSCALCCGTVRVVVTPGQSRLVTPQPARPQLGREKISCWGQPGVPVLSQPGNVINTNYLLLLLLSPRLTLTPGNGTKNIYHTLPVWWWDTLHSTPSWWLNNFSSIDKWHIIGYCKLHKW